MTTTLANCRILLSKALGDYFASTTTSAGASTYDTLIDTELKAKSEDWITDETYTLITKSGDSSEDDERKATKLDNGTGALTTLPHTAQIGSSITYELHRLFTASEKRRALIHAAKAGFPYIFREIRDESKTVGNWLRNGDVEEWASVSYPDYWRVSGVTATENTTAPYYTRGSSSCKLDTATGYLYQSNTQVADLIDLADVGITFTARVWCNKASCAKLAIYDGTTTTSSSYHTGGSDFEELSVSATIASSPSQVSLRVYLDDNTGTIYVDDLRCTGSARDKIYIGDLDLAQNKPHQVLQSTDAGIYNEPWKLLRDYTIGSDGYLYLPDASSNYRLRILGIGYLNFLKDGAVSTAWDSEIALDSPQTEILVAEAAIYLCNQMIVPNQTRGTSELWKEALGYWKAELRDRQGRFGMQAPSATVHWR